MDLPAQRIAQFAVLLWLGSLALPAFTAYGGDVPGAMVLLLGWAGLNVAWLSNFFFLKAATYVGTRQPDPPVGSAVAALLLSVDTVRFTDIYSDAGTEAVFGYGWGALLWFLALALMLVATGQRVREQGLFGVDESDWPVDAAAVARRLTICGVCTVIAILSGTLFMAIWDRRSPNTADRVALESSLFKRRPVCTVDVPAAAALGHPRSIQVNSAIDSRWTWFRADPLRFLELPIDFLRVGKFDYFLAGSGNGSEVRARSAHDSVDLRVDVTARDGRAELSLASSRGHTYQIAWKELRLPFERSADLCPASADPVEITARATGMESGPNGRYNFYRRGLPFDLRSQQVIAARPAVAARKRSSQSVVWAPSQCSDTHGPQYDFSRTHPEAQGLGTAVMHHGIARFRLFWPQWSDGGFSCSDDSLLLFRARRDPGDVRVIQGVELASLSLRDLTLEYALFAETPLEIREGIYDLGMAQDLGNEIVLILTSPGTSRNPKFTSTMLTVSRPETLLPPTTEPVSPSRD